MFVEREEVRLALVHLEGGRGRAGNRLEERFDRRISASLMNARETTLTVTSGVPAKGFLPAGNNTSLIRSFGFTTCTPPAANGRSASANSLPQ